MRRTHDYAAASRAWPGNTFRLGLAIEQRGRSWTTWEAEPTPAPASPQHNCTGATDR